jgi:hypothetical protein
MPDGKTSGQRKAFIDNCQIDPRHAAAAGAQQQQALPE